MATVERADAACRRLQVPTPSRSIPTRRSAGPLAVRFLITGRNSSGSVAAFEIIVPGAQRLAAPAHSHDQYEETIYGIDGVLTWTVNGKQIDVGPGQALCIPRGAVHRFDNNGSQGCEGALRHHAGRHRSRSISASLPR